MLEVISGYIDRLPAEITPAIHEHIGVIEIESFRALCSGLQKLRQNTLPTEHELDVIAHPGDLFKDIAAGIRRAARIGPVSLESEKFIASQIVAPLEEAAQTFIVGPDRAFVAWWFENLQDDPNGPFTPPPGPEAN